MEFWSQNQIDQAIKILSKYPRERYQDAIEKIARVTKRNVSPSSLRHAFQRLELGPPTSYLVGTTPVEEPAPERFQDLLRLTKKGPILFTTLCDKLDLSPARAKALVEEARAKKIDVHVEHDHVGIRSKASDAHVQEVGIAPVVGKRQKIAVISDTHLGSKYCLGKQLREFIEYAYAQGVREILHPGDVLEGMYRHATFETSHVGIEDQARALYETLPHLPGLNYRCITGNHDFTFTESAGVNVGERLRDYFRARGRKDLHFYGDRSAFLKVKGAVVHLWHPRTGTSYARSYQLQKTIEKYGIIKPQILLAGHWHIFCQVYERGVHALACPTFQGGGSAFSKSLGGAPAIGGLILSWDLTEHGTIRSFLVEKRSYFEHERPVDIRNDLDGEVV